MFATPHARKPAPALAVRALALRRLGRPDAFGSALGDSIVQSIKDNDQRNGEQWQPGQAGGGRGFVNPALVDPDQSVAGGSTPGLLENFNATRVAMGEAPISLEDPNYSNGPQYADASDAIKKFGRAGIDWMADRVSDAGFAVDRMLNGDPVGDRQEAERRFALNRQAIAAENKSNGWVDDGLSCRPYYDPGSITELTPEMEHPALYNNLNRQLAQSTADGLTLVAGDAALAVLLKPLAKVAASAYWGLRSETAVLNNDLNVALRSGLAADLPSVTSLDGLSPGAPIQTYWPPKGGFYGPTTTQTIQSGEKFSRYGGYFDDNGAFRDLGNFVAPADVPFEARALPASSLSKPLSTYQVVKPIPDVLTGKATPWFGEIGQGTQHQLSMPIEDLLDLGYIKLVDRVVPPSH